MGWEGTSNPPALLMYPQCPPPEGTWSVLAGPLLCTPGTPASQAVGWCSLGEPLTRV